MTERKTEHYVYIKRSTIILKVASQMREFLYDGICITESKLREEEALTPALPVGSFLTDKTWFPLI